MKPEPETVNERKPELEDVVLSYLQAVDARRAPDSAEVIARHPHLAAELQAYFANEKQLHPLVEPLRQGATAPKPEPAPERIGAYELREEIARGGMGAVVRVYDAVLKRELAVKVLREEMRDR